MKTFQCRWRLLVSSLCLSLILSGSLFAKEKKVDPEPAYCDPSAFDAKEMDLGDGLALEKKGLNRIHAFHLGKVTLVGLGVGNSKADEVMDFAKAHSASSSSQAPKLLDELKKKNYCTWYLNRPEGPDDARRVEAAKTFQHRDIGIRPQKSSEEVAVREFMKVMESSFDQDSTSFLACAEEQNYIALGCNNMMHRGPTVFGMLLAFSGCTPEHALEISDQTWGLNGVKRTVRLAVLKKAFELGQAHLASRKKLAELFSK